MADSDGKGDDKAKQKESVVYLYVLLGYGSVILLSIMFFLGTAIFGKRISEFRATPEEGVIRPPEAEEE